MKYVTSRFQHTIKIAGLNDLAPEFDKAEYSGSISKSLPPNVPLHFIDSDLTITVTDHDYVNPSPPRPDDDTSCDEVQETCEVVDTDLIDCKTEATAEEGVYNVILSLNKRIDDYSNESLTFKIRAKVRPKYVKVPSSFAFHPGQGRQLSNGKCAVL